MEFKYEIDNTYIHYVKFGNGKKNLIIIFGVSLLGLEGLGNAIEKQYDSFKDEYTCYVFDRRKDLDSSIGIFDLARDLKKVLSDLGLEKAYIYGVSQGGMIGLAFTLLYPNCVEKLCLVSTTAKPKEMSKSVLKELRGHIDRNDIYNLNMSLYKYIYSTKYFEDNIRAFERLAGRGTKEALNRFSILLKQIDDFDVLDRLDEIKCPCFVFGGEKDRIFTVEEFKELSKGLNCDLLIYDGASHAVYDEVPDVLFKLREFLDK